jgi:hypothetical protein
VLGTYFVTQVLEVSLFKDDPRFPLNLSVYLWEVIRRQRALERRGREQGKW